MSTHEVKNLIDLFVDDELSLEQATEFREAMFKDPELEAEVNAYREGKRVFWEAFASDKMTTEEHKRVCARIMAEALAPDIHRAPQLGLPLTDQFSLPISTH